jgi:magnesium transporter
MLTAYAYRAAHLVKLGSIVSVEAPADLAETTDATVVAAKPESPVWVDLVNPTEDEDELVAKHLAINIPTRSEMEEIELSSRLYSEDGAEFLTITALAQIDSDAPIKTPVTFIVKGTTLVTVRYADPRPFLSFAARAQRTSSASCKTGELVMLGLIEALIDRIADSLEKAGNEVDTISGEVFRGKDTTVTKKTRNLQSVIERIGRQGDRLTMFRESLVSMTRLTTYHTAIESSASRSAAKEVRTRLKVIQRDIGSLSDHAAYLSSKINFLLDATLGLINLEQNQIIKIFSVAAVVFLPPTLVASVYGMNFDLMPELHFEFGYPIALLLMVVSAVLPYLYFKRRGWL